MLILAFLALIPRLIFGFLVIQVLWKSTDSKHLLIKVFLAGPVGIGLSSLLSFAWLWSKSGFTHLRINRNWHNRSFVSIYCLEAKGKNIGIPKGNKTTNKQTEQIVGRNTCPKSLHFHWGILDKIFAKSAWQMGRLVKLECSSQIRFQRWRTLDRNFPANI